MCLARYQVTVALGTLNRLQPEPFDPPLPTADVLASCSATSV